MPEEIVNTKGATESGKRTVGLESQSRFWNTPNAHDGRRPQDDTSTQGANLLRQASQWPTPCSQDDNKSPEAHMAMKARMKGGQRKTITSLSVLTQLWPTPNSADQKTSPDYPHKGGNPTLVGAASHWPTPDCNTASYSSGAFGENIREAASNWTTPKASDAAKGGPNMHGTKGDTPLPNMAANWASPTARMVKGGGREHDEEERPQPHRHAGLSIRELFAPGPSDPRWRDTVADHPELAPAVKPGIRRMVNGLAYRVDQYRTDRLRCGGNGVVAAQAAAALIALVRRMNT